MTTVFETAVTCAVCGREQSVQEMGSTSSFGPMDLDTRPPPVRRHSLRLWVHECEECGFVCRSLLDEAAGDLVAAGWRRVHAAWASDDAGHDTEARVQRFEAIGLFERARLDGERAMKSVVGGDEVLLADLSRRARAAGASGVHEAAAVLRAATGGGVRSGLRHGRGGGGASAASRQSGRR
jgi:hypothetical protein